ncbi:putative methyltransferase YcgJ [Paenibacillus konkukensis]|uniref:Methyltransferase YcgJ n=1 Tax=Paenibacillus konkukensis TaxID=2020716 RepID=A0ABY4RTJ0_9BACL|nr:class I SAM-dependent methyltransferase [Paenibacillus konkukensis]UQZ85906.1 putative methyltransferase YcgJ [Paenibacillus konkukensis]
MDIKEQVKLQFGPNAAKYVNSPGHASGEDLRLLAEWVQAENGAAGLDIATGGGHAALVLAEHVRQATTLDLTPQMLQEAEAFLRSRGKETVRYVQGDAEKLPFEAESFDVVTCRIAAHHFPDPDAFVGEAARVLKHGGSFILFDNIAPESDDADALYNEVEKRRDPSHYRAWKKTEWIRRAELAGLRVELLVQTRKTFVFDPWCGRMNVSEQVKRELEAYMLGWDDSLRRQLGVSEEEGRVVFFQGDYMMLKTRKVR